MKKWLITAALLALPFGSSPVFAQTSCPSVNAQNSALKGPSPLLAQEHILLRTPPAVQYEFLRQVYPNLGLTRGQFLNLPIEQANASVSEGYYVATLGKAMLASRNDAELVQILESLLNGGNLQTVVKSFDRRYHEKFGVWAPIVPVDVEALTDRMLNQRTIR